jgi:Tfp pilus assembly PilM family ATPase
MSRPREVLARLFSTPGPAVGIEVGATRVSAVALAWDKGVPQIVRHARAELPKGAVIPSPSAVNIHDREAVTDGIRKVLDVLPGRTTRVGLTVPDVAAKVSFVQFDKVPTRTADLERLIAWQVRRSVPFRIEDAQLAYTAAARRPDGGQEFIVALIRRDIVEEYEAVCRAAGVHAGVVDLTGFNVINAAITVSPMAESDWLLVHLAEGYCTLAIVRNRDVIFFRNRPTGNMDDVADLAHQTAMYYQDRLNGRGLARTVLVGDLNGSDGTLPAMLETRFGTPVERLGATSTIATPGMRPGGLDLLAGPVGLLMREHLPAA